MFSRERRECTVLNQLPRSRPPFAALQQATETVTSFNPIWSNPIAELILFIQHAESATNFLHPRSGDVSHLQLTIYHCPCYNQQQKNHSMSNQIELVQSDSRQQAESSANNRIEEYEQNGFELVDQEVAVGNNSVTLLLVFETAE